MHVIQNQLKVIPLAILGFQLNSDPLADDLLVEELDPKQLCTL